jgi:hypothetical protein
VETSVFLGAKFVDIEKGMESKVDPGFKKLRVMGIPINGPAHVCGDNMSVIRNMQRPKSMLKKKSNHVCHHCCRESALKKTNELQRALVARVYRVTDASVLKQCVCCMCVPCLYQVLV